MWDWKCSCPHRNSPGSYRCSWIWGGCRTHFTTLHRSNRSNEVSTKSKGWWALRLHCPVKSTRSPRDTFIPGPNTSRRTNVSWSARGHIHTRSKYKSPHQRFLKCTWSHSHQSHVTRPTFREAHVVTWGHIQTRHKSPNQRSWSACGHLGTHSHQTQVIRPTSREAHVVTWGHIHTRPKSPDQRSVKRTWSLGDTFILDQRSVKRTWSLGDTFTPDPSHQTNVPWSACGHLQPHSHKVQAQVTRPTFCEAYVVTWGHIHTKHKSPDQRSVKRTWSLEDTFIPNTSHQTNVPWSARGHLRIHSHQTPVKSWFTLMHTQPKPTQPSQSSH